jgi:hypothetical protein
MKPAFHLILVLALAAPAISVAQEVANAPSGEIRVLDKLTGVVSDVIFTNGEERTFGKLTVRMNQCRYPISNPAGDAFAEVTVTYAGTPAPVFEGWLIASAPALNALDHPRYDVWALRCITS